MMKDTPGGPKMPLNKPYPPTAISYSDWNDLADNYAGKATTLIVDAGGKGDYTTIQEAIDALPPTNAGEILVREGEYPLSRVIIIEDREDLVIRGVGKATRLKVANKAQEAITSDAASGQKEVQVASGSSFQTGQHVCVRDDTHYEVNVVTSINGNTLTMEDDLANAYEVADNGRVYTCHSAIWITGSSKRVKVQNLYIDGNRLNQTFDRYGYYPEEHHGDCIRLSATTEQVTVEGCYITGAAAHGICCGGTIQRISRNFGWDNYLDAVNVEPGSSRILVEGNHCWSQASWNGIQVGYSTNPIGTVLVIGNVCRDNRQGIAAQGGANVAIVGNILEENREDAIEVYNLDRFLISGNLITGADDLSDMTNAGIHVEAECSIGVITGNLVECVAGYGVYVQEGAYVSVTGNTIRKIAKHGVKYGNESNDQGRDGSITGNVVIAADVNDTATYSGICVIGDRTAVIGNRVDDCDKYGIHIHANADRCIVLGNQAYQYVGTCVAPIQDDGTNTEEAHNVTA